MIRHPDAGRLWTVVPVALLFASACDPATPARQGEAQVPRAEPQPRDVRTIEYPGLSSPVDLAFEGEAALVLSGIGDIVLHRLNPFDGTVHEIETGLSGSPTAIALNAHAVYIDDIESSGIYVVPRGLAPVEHLRGHRSRGYFAVDSHGTVLTSGSSGAMGFLLWARETWPGQRAGFHFAYRPTNPEVRRVNPVDRELPGVYLIATTPGDTVHVFDNASGILFKFDPEGDPVLFRRLPPSMLSTLVADNWPGYGQAGRPLALHLEATCGGNLVLSLNLASRPAAYLVRSASYDIQEIDPSILTMVGGRHFFACGDRVYGLDHVARTLRHAEPITNP